MYVLVIIIMAGCADDLRHRSVFDGGAGDAVIRFSVEDATLTRDGETEDNESVVDHAYLLFYSEEASLPSDIPVAAVRAESDSSTPGNLKFKMPLSLQPNTDYQLLAIANADDYAPSGFENFGEYLESWCRASSSEKSPLHLYCQSNITPDSKTNLPMNGGTSGSSAFRFSMDNGVYTVSASLSFRRMVARIDVANMVKDGFKVEGIALCNWRDAMPVAAYDSQIGNRFGSVHDFLPNDGQTLRDDIFIDMPSADENGIQQLNKKIYCFPSGSNDSFLGDQESTALIIKAKYGDDTGSTYYRVNVGTKGNVSKIDPNTKYLVTIRSVKGSGAPTPEEAYFATESQIVLSVVEGWDLEGNAFDMDNYGNFIVLSKGSLEFEEDATDNVEVRVLTSKGLLWTAEYIADNDESVSAFSVAKLSDTAIAIAPSGENEDEVPMTGKCRVTANTTQGTTLRVDVALRQEAVEKMPYEPEIPTDMPFAIIPLDSNRVKIDHKERTIEIDGFEPNCFNSFIDVPFKVYIDENCENQEFFSIKSDLEWPLEGGIGTQTHEDHYYCANSFNTSSAKGYSVFSKKYNKELGKLEAFEEVNGINPIDGDIIYISVGSMAPDDPAIKRTVTLSIGYKNSVIYNLVIKPKPVIIDDVVLTDSKGNRWLIFDRNIQKKDADYVGRDSNGKKRQAYNFLFQSPACKIPFKYRDSYGSPSEEILHSLYCGIDEPFENKGNLSLKNAGSGDSKSISWLKSYIYSDGHERTSPFYEESDIEKWTFPTQDLLELCASKIRVSKMRLYLVSDVPVKSGRNKIPICCYWPFNIDFDTSMTCGYYFSESSGDPESMLIINYDKAEIHTSMPSSLDNSMGLSRLVRPISTEELNSYKQNYLGYGSQPHKLTICHPDTYESTPLGWIPD